MVMGTGRRRLKGSNSPFWDVLSSTASGILQGITHYMRHDLGEYRNDDV